MEERLELSASAAGRLWREMAACEGTGEAGMSSEMVRSQVQWNVEERVGRRRLEKGGGQNTEHLPSRPKFSA